MVILITATTTFDSPVPIWAANRVEESLSFTEWLPVQEKYIIIGAQCEMLCTQWEGAEVSTDDMIDWTQRLSSLGTDNQW